ncbi:MAG: rod shape-determining protein MreC [Clostridiales Family XIII bacterium]|jgi:rod shape-determining protein MreC|nr:rod shape-determining protein MreC [Clostridiales Family XIII bacterium]
MRWFAQHRFLTLIVAILAAFLILFGVSYNLQGNGTVVGKVARSFVTIVQRPVISLVDKISGGDAKNGGTGKSENDKLKAEVEALKQELQLSQLENEEYTELKALSDSFNIMDSVAGMKPVAANVITYNNTDTFNIFTIDAGTESDVKRNSVVICGDGLVGRVLSSDKGWAKVISITDENNKIGFQVTEQKDGKEEDFLGVCSGDGEGNLVGSLLDEEGFAIVDDEVVTSGLGGIYPAGITIGKVIKAEYTSKNQLMEISIKPAAYFKGLKKVIVLI